MQAEVRCYWSLFPTVFFSSNLRLKKKIKKIRALIGPVSDGTVAQAK